MHPDDLDMKKLSFDEIKNKFIVVTEKIDGSNCSLQFINFNLVIQTRKTILTGGEAEKPFSLLKAWCSRFSSELFELLNHRYILYGEWMNAKHTIFYDMLPHYFLAFDIYDKERNQFLSTKKQLQILQEFPFIKRVEILFTGKLEKFEQLTNLLGILKFISTNNVENLKKACKLANYNFETALKETDLSKNMEGLYIKVEDEDKVLTRCNFVRKDFTIMLDKSGTHWKERPILQNLLKSDVDIFA